MVFELMGEERVNRWRLTVRDRIAHDRVAVWLAGLSNLWSL